MATNYWTKTTTKLNSVYGTASNISTVSSGSVSGSNPQILKIEVYSRVSSGSDSFYLYVEDGNGNVNYTTVSKSGTITINDFNGFDPSGNWYKSLPMLLIKQNKIRFQGRDVCGHIRLVI